jgi:hypothetical protein
MPHMKKPLAVSAELLGKRRSGGKSKAIAEYD